MQRRRQGQGQGQAQAQGVKRRKKQGPWKDRTRPIDLHLLLVLCKKHIINASISRCRGLLQGPFGRGEVVEPPLTKKIRSTHERGERREGEGEGEGEGERERPVQVDDGPTHGTGCSSHPHGDASAEQEAGSRAEE